MVNCALFFNTLEIFHFQINLSISFVKFSQFWDIKGVLVTWWGGSHDTVWIYTLYLEPYIVLS